MKCTYLYRSRSGKSSGLNFISHNLSCADAQIFMIVRRFVWFYNCFDEIDHSASRNGPRERHWDLRDCRMIYSEITAIQPHSAYSDNRTIGHSFLCSSLIISILNWKTFPCSRTLGFWKSALMVHFCNNFDIETSFCPLEAPAQESGTITSLSWDWTVLWRLNWMKRSSFRILHY